MSELAAALTDQPVTFRLWGAVEAYQNGRRFPLGPQREQRMLAGLLAAKGKQVARETLKKWIWDDEPEKAAEDLKALMTGLRKRLADLGFVEVLNNKNGTCQLDVPAAAVDVHRVKALVAAPKRSDQHAADLLGLAVRLSDGEPLAGLSSPGINNYRIELERERHALRIAYYQAEVRLGRHQNHVGELSRLFDDHLDDAVVTALTMCALYFAGRTTDAGSVYMRHQRHLRKEVGVEVSPEIQELYSRMLDNNLAKDTCSFALGTSYPVNGESPMDTTSPLLMAIRPDSGNPAEVQQAVMESLGDSDFRVRLLDDCLICVVAPGVLPEQVVRVWPDRLLTTVRQRAQIGIARGPENNACDLARSDFARTVRNGSGSSNLVVVVSDDLHSLVTGSGVGKIDTQSYRQAEDGLDGWVRVPGRTQVPHPRDDEPDHASRIREPASGSSGAAFYGDTKIGQQNIATQGSQNNASINEMNW
jgi:DNA-binding SARP family transcriptional activator